MCIYSRGISMTYVELGKAHQNLQHIFGYPGGFGGLLIFLMWPLFGACLHHAAGHCTGNILSSPIIRRKNETMSQHDICRKSRT